MARLVHLLTEKYVCGPLSVQIDEIDKHISGMKG